MGFDVADVPLLPGGWILVAEAADILSLSKQSVHGLIRSGTIKSTHRLGRNPDKTIYVLSEAEILILATERSETRQNSVLTSVK
jgi:hypothetical protein